MSEREREPVSVSATRSGAIAWMASNPVAANLLMFILLIGGLLMSTRVKQEVFPETELDMIAVNVPYPGASPAEIEQGIILAVEEGVRGIDGVKRVVSTASEGQGSVHVELEVSADKEKALADVKSAVDRITSLPKESERPVVSMLTNRVEVLSIVIYGARDPGALRDLAERARDQLLSDPRITQVDLAGAPAREISIEVPREQLRVHDLTLDAIAQRIGQTAVQVPGGGVKTAGGDVLVRTNERRGDASGFADIPMVTGPGGTELRLGDIAMIRAGFADTDESASYDGLPAIMLKVFRVGEQKPTEVAAAVRQQSLEIERFLPEGVQVAHWLDMSEVYAERVDLLMRNSFMGLLLVMVCLGLFLELRVAFWVTMGIPTSFMGALMLMPSLGVSVNMVTLFAFIVVLGMVVDDAVVVGENIFERSRRGGGLGAAIAGAQQVGVPVVFSVLTTVAAFTPMFFVPGFSGKMFGVIPMIVISVLLISLVDSLFILPAHLGHLKKPRRGGLYARIERQQRRVTRGLDRFVRGVYAPFVRTAMVWRYLTLAIGVGVLILCAGFVNAGLINFRFFPAIDGDIVTASAELPFGTSVEQTREVQQELLTAAQEVLAAHGGDQVSRGVFAQIGARAGDIGGPGGDLGQRRGGHLTNVQVYLVASDRRDFKSSEFVAEWRARVGTIAAAKSLQFNYSLGPSAGRPVDVELSHRDDEVLARAGEAVAAALRGYAGVTDIQNGVVRGKLQLDLTLRPEATQLGLTVTEVARQVRAAFHGAEALRQQFGRDEVRVLVRLPAVERRSERDIVDLLIRTPAGGELPLHEAADISRTRSWPTIERADGRRIIHTTADLREGETSAGLVLSKLASEVLGGLPERFPGLTWALGGENREQRESLGSLGVGAMMSLLAIYALLAIPFGSYVQPLIVMCAIPFGVVGAIGGHVLLGLELSAMSIMGIVALSGVVVNDSLVLIDAANAFRRGGMSAFEAAIAAGVRRFRPIMLTSITTFFGLVPMILEPSVQARFLIPMAVSLGFGVMFATAVTLFIVPGLYLALEDLMTGSRALFAADEPEVDIEEEDDEDELDEVEIKL